MVEFYSEISFEVQMLFVLCG